MIALTLPDSACDVLCLGAHPDDIEIGCGGTLLRLARRPGVRVSGLVLTGSGQRADEAAQALPAFVPGASVDVVGLEDGRLPSQWGEVKQAMEDAAANLTPDLVLAPRVDDAHQDHRLVGSLARTVWRDSLVLHYEIPKWDGDMGSPSHFVALSEPDARRKVELLDKSFGSQASRDWWDDELFLGLMRVRGVECRARYAEGFYTSKVLLDLSEEGAEVAESCID